MKNRSGLLLTLLAAALALALAGCGFTGTSYLALTDDSGIADNIIFPALPVGAFLDTYYEHPDGTYPGEYTWGIEFHEFYYTIEEERGFFPGTQGSDRYYLMYLESTGPELYYASFPLSMAGKGAKQAPSRSLNNSPVDRSLFDLDHPEPYSWERTENGVTFKVTGNRYRRK
jgi:hypothetical protein